jgi:molecular chaperone DnaJ
MPADFYTVLGTADDASEAELKSAYRSRVREFHPDVNDSPDADAQFKLVRKAHDVLSNPVERNTYDRIGHRDYVAKHFDSLPTLSVFSHIDEADAPGTTASSTNNTTSEPSANGSSTTSSAGTSSNGGESGDSNRSSTSSTGSATNGSGGSQRSTNRTRTSGTASNGQSASNGGSASSRSTGASRTSQSSQTGDSTRTTTQRSHSSSASSSTSSTSSQSTTSASQRSSSSQNGASAAGSTARASTSTSTGSSTASTRTTRETSTSDSTTAEQSAYTNEKPSHVGDQVTREEAERNVAERMQASEQTVSAGQRRRRGLKRWYGVVVLSLVAYLGGLGAYAVQHLAAVQTLATQVTAAPVPTLTAVGRLPSPTAFALSPVAAQTPTLGAALLAGVVLLPLVLGTTVARYGRGSAWLYVLGSTVPVLALAAWMVIPVPLWAAVLALVAAPVVGAGAFLVDVGRYLSATRT